MEKFITSSEKMGFSRPLDACLESGAQSPRIGGAAIQEAQEPCLPSVFEQLTWQRGGPDKHVWLSRVSFTVYTFRTLWCCSGLWHFSLWLSLVRSWWVGEPQFSPLHSTVESWPFSDHLPWRDGAGRAARQRQRSEPLTLILILAASSTRCSLPVYEVS